MGDSHLSAPPRADPRATEASQESTTAGPGDAARSWGVRQRAAAATVLAFAALVTVTAYGYGLHEGTQPGPGLFPFVVGALLTFLAAVWLLKPGRPESEESGDLVTTVLDESEQEAAESQVEEELDWGHGGAFRFGATLLVTAIAVGLFVSLGYTVAVAFYTAALLTVVARQRPLWSIVGAILGAMVSRALFDYLGVVVPSLPVHIPFLPWAVL
ncbi:tripartite tricarboxylate transporter TctB family protein [Phytohabitans kaempferiae]|uniref:Tripartite tricarboxylate transporter TctB family protein n=1 Tax=Phytohabitans kaempferiae TaxID=1620943 RepID=A0ABV6MH42_9ACTN